MSLYTESVEEPIRKGSPFPCSSSEQAGEMRLASQNASTGGSASFNSYEHQRSREHVILYYTNVRDELLRCVKPAEAPLKLKVSKKDFRLGHYFDDSQTIKDLIADMKTSSSRTPLMNLSHTAPNRRGSASTANGESSMKVKGRGGHHSSISHSGSYPLRGARLYGMRNAIFLSELEEKQKVRDAEREAYLQDLRGRIESIPVELARPSGRVEPRCTADVPSINPPPAVGSVNVSAGFGPSGGEPILHHNYAINSREESRQKNLSKLKVAGSSDVIGQHSMREGRKVPNGSRKTKKVIDSIVKGWVSEGMGDHIPEVRLVNSERAVLSQLEKGTFRAERQPPLPFFKPSTSSSTLLVKASSPPLASSTSQLPDTTSPLLLSKERAPSVDGRPATAPSSRHSTSNVRDGSLKLLSRSQDTSSSLFHQYLQDINQQPIRSYRAFYNATVAPQKIKKNERIKPKKNELGGSVYYKEEVERSRHRFDHLRFEKQVEVEDFIKWRGKCRGVVSAALANSDEKLAVNDKQLKLFGHSGKSHLHASTRSKIRGDAYSGPWLEAAVNLAVEEERKRICECVENFKLDFTAATLSREAMESLRAQVLEKIRAKPFRDPDSRIFSKGEFVAFLSSRTKKADMESHAGAMITSSGSDVVDAMHSPAEAALAKYILSILPT